MVTSKHLVHEFAYTASPREGFTVTFFPIQLTWTLRFTFVKNILAAETCVLAGFFWTLTLRERGCQQRAAFILMGYAFQCHFSWTILLFPELWSQWYLSLTPPDFSFKIDWFVLGPEARGAKSWCPKKFGPFYQGDLVIVKSARDLDQVLTISACKLLHIFGQLYKGMPYHRTSLGIIKNHWKSSESIRHHWNPISKKKTRWGGSNE